MLVARFYTVAEVGAAAAVISAMNLLAALSLVGLGDAIIRFLPKAEKPRKLLPHGKRRPCPGACRCIYCRNGDMVAGARFSQGE
jgi:hypothetical protein